MTSVYKCSVVDSPCFFFSPLYICQVHGMISQMDPALVAYCDKIAAQGGPVHLSNELRGSTFPATPVVQLGTATRLSARLHNVEPEVSVDQSYEALKHTKKSSDVARGGMDRFIYSMLVIYVPM